MSEERIEHRWRGEVGDDELSALHAAAFGHDPVTGPWRERLDRYSLGWVTAREGAVLVGFVNVVGDGGRHAFLVDMIVRPDRQGTGVGREVLARAVAECRRTPAEWLHVDFEPELAGFYLRSGGFRPTPAGLVHLS